MEEELETQVTGEGKQIFRLNWLRLSNYRCFGDFEINFSPNYNVHVILANNMAGKTAILDAISTNLSLFTIGSAIPGYKTHLSIFPEDHEIIGEKPFSDRRNMVGIYLGVEYRYTGVRGKSQWMDLVLTKDRGSPRDKKTLFSITSSEQENERRKPSGPLGVEISSVFTDKREFQEEVNENLELTKLGKSILPLFNYVPTNYLYSEDPIRNVKKEEGIDEESAVYFDKDFENEDEFLAHIYTDDFAENGYFWWYRKLSIRNFVFSWLAAKQSLRVAVGDSPGKRKHIGDVPFDAWDLVRQNLIVIFQDKYGVSEIVDVEWFESKDNRDLLITFSNGAVRPFNSLSDGYQYLVLMVTELTVRALLLNKHLRLEACLKSEGVVLIDEFGVHLHPELQETILTRLREIFPNLQFIITTHSPMLLNGLMREQIHILETDETGNRTVRHPEEDVTGLGAEGILRRMFMLESTLDDETREAILELRRIRRVGDKATVADLEKLPKLEKLVGKMTYDGSNDDPWYQQFLKVYREKLENMPSLSVATQTDDEIEKMMNEVVNEIIENGK